MKESSLLTPAPATTLKCPVCNQSALRQLNRLQHGRHMYRCEACRLIFAHPYWSSQDAHEIFTDRHVNPQAPGGIYTAINNRLPAMQAIAKLLKTRLPANATLLDIGCGGGLLFDVLRPVFPGGTFYGVEPAAQWHQHVYPNAMVDHRLMREVNFASGMFDVVTLLDTLYYIPECYDELAEIKRVLKPGGWLVFDHAGLNYLRLRGAVGSLLRLSRTVTFGGYPFYYSIASVRHLMKEAGYELVEEVVDTGIRHESPLFRLTVPLYTQMVRLLARTHDFWQEFAPKIVYYARRID